MNHQSFFGTAFIIGLLMLAEVTLGRWLQPALFSSNVALGLVVVASGLMVVLASRYE